jgi:predicted component of type VI protein secretion system
MAKLILTLPDGMGIEHTLTGEIVLGRDPTSSLTLNDTKASRRHCRFYLAGGIWMLEDLGSSNGTVVNGMLAKRKRLAHGDRIQIGGTVIVYDAPNDVPEAAPIPAKSAPSAPVRGSGAPVPGSAPARGAGPARRADKTRPNRRGR